VVTVQHRAQRVHAGQHQPQIPAAGDSSVTAATTGASAASSASGRSSAEARVSSTDIRSICRTPARPGTPGHRPANQPRQLGQRQAPAAPLGGDLPAQRLRTIRRAHPFRAPARTAWTSSPASPPIGALPTPPVAEPSGRSSTGQPRDTQPTAHTAERAAASHPEHRRPLAQLAPADEHRLRRPAPTRRAPPARRDTSRPRTLRRHQHHDHRQPGELGVPALPHPHPRAARCHARRTPVRHHAHRPHHPAPVRTFFTKPSRAREARRTPARRVDPGVIAADRRREGRARPGEIGRARGLAGCA